MDIVLKTILEVSVMGAVVILITLLVRHFFSRKIPLAIMTVLWSMALIRLLLPVTIMSPIHFADLLPEKAVVENIDLIETEKLPVLQNPQTSDPVPSGLNVDGMISTPKNIPDNMALPQEPSFWQQFKATTDNLSVNNLLLLLWLAGVLTVLHISIIKSILFKRKLSVCPPITDVSLCKTLQGHCRVRKIKRPVRIISCDFIAMPSVYGWISPSILIPPQFIDRLDQKSMSAILLHEACHIRRNDILIKHLWLAAKALHWFNPLVWLAYRTVQEDMELSCDRKVIKTLGKRGTALYSQTLLALSRFMPESASPAIVASFCKKSSALKGRIMRMVKPEKRSKPAVVISAVLALLMVIGCFTTACQPTPEDEIVQSKDNDAIEQAIAQNPVGDSAGQTAADPYTAPGTYTGEVHDETKHVDLYIDAGVSVPADTWNMYELVPLDVDQEHIDTMIHALIGDALLYNKNFSMSRDELEEDIIEAKAIAAGLDEETQGELIDYYNDQIDLLTQAMQDAGDEAVKMPVNTQLDGENYRSMDEVNVMISVGEPVESITESTNVIEGLADLGGEPAQLNINKLTGSLRFQSIDTKDTNFGFTKIGPLPAEGLPETTISLEEAMETARGTLRNMGFDYLDITYTGMTELYAQEYMAGDQAHQCYSFIFTRHIGGAPVTYAEGDGVMTDDEMDQAYGILWDSVEAEVVVDDSGVLKVNIGHQKSEVDQLAEGVELMDFDEIMKIFEQQAVIEGCFSSYGAYSSDGQSWVEANEVHVDSIELGYMPIAWKDHTNQLILVPVWDFFGSDTVTFNTDNIGRGDLYSALDENNQMSFDLERQSILTINAIDGTIIDRDFGY